MSGSDTGTAAANNRKGKTARTAEAPAPRKHWLAAQTKPAQQIPVSAYRQILIWPLLLEDTGATQGSEFDIASVSSSSQLSKWIELLKGSAWEEAKTLPDEVVADGLEDPVSCDPNYEEMIYFHPFVRDFLYGDGRHDVDERSLRRFRRTDVSTMKVELCGDDREFVFDVDRVELYFCKPLVAMLVMEVSWSAQRGQPGELTLADVQLLQPRLRQAYPPFFQSHAAENGKETVRAGNSPRRIQFMATGHQGQPVPIQDRKNGWSQTVGVSDFDAGRTPFARFTHEGAEPPVSAHWEWLLLPLKPFPGWHRSGKYVRQIVDDRIPGMTYVSVDDPRAINQGDFDRLVFCETPGQAPFPYSRRFLDAKRRRYVYDRFWRSSDDGDGGEELTLNTRYLCSGFQFVAVGSSQNWFFSNVILTHFRRHYFRIGLIVHYHRASLLKFYDELADAIKLVKGKSPFIELDDAEFRDRIMALQVTFLKFRSRSWFDEVSNQLQGQEMFQWWSKRLGNRKLMDEVEQVSNSLYAALAEYHSRRLTQYAVRIAVIALLVTLAGLLVAILK